MVSRRKFLRSAVGSVAAIPFVNVLESRAEEPPKSYDGLYMIQLGDDKHLATEQDILEAKNMLTNSKDFLIGLNCLAGVYVKRQSSLRLTFIPLRGPLSPIPAKELYIKVGCPERPATPLDAEDIYLNVKKALSNWRHERLNIITHHNIWMGTDTYSPQMISGTESSLMKHKYDFGRHTRRYVLDKGQRLIQINNL